MASRVYLFDCDRKVDLAVPSADAIIGRDSFLQCTDKRISREHGIIKQSADELEHSIEITSTHANPIFIRTEDDVLNILTKDLTATLREGDKFALLPDQYWFEVRFRPVAGEASAPSPQESAVSTSGVAPLSNGTLRVRTMEEVNNAISDNGDGQQLPQAPENGTTGEKRKISDEAEADSTKRVRTGTEPDPEVATAAAAAAQSDHNDPEVSSEVDTAGDATAPGDDPVTVKTDPDASDAACGSSSNQKQPAAPADVKKETADSTGPPPRPSCQYGIRCYRHTPDHRAQFAHPSDSDYRRPTFPPAPDDAPNCPFGASCYRRNPEHFREYQHPDSTAVLPVSYQVPVVQPQPQQQPPAPQQQQQQRRRRNTFARDILMAAIANPALFAGDSDEDDRESLFDYDSDSDEYRPGRESADEDDDDEDNEPEEEDDDGGGSDAGSFNFAYSDVDEE